MLPRAGPESFRLYLTLGASVSFNQVMILISAVIAIVKARRADIKIPHIASVT